MMHRTFGIVLVLALATPHAAHAIHVVSMSPARYALAVPVSGVTVSVTFDQDLAPAAAGAMRVCGTMSGLHNAGDVSVTGPTITFTDAVQPFMPGEMVNVNLRRDIRSTAGSDSLQGGYYFAFTLASAPAALEWSRHVGYGASDVPYFIYGGDMDEDGTPDVASPNEGTGDVSVFLNTSGAGFFPVRHEYNAGDIPSCVFGEDFDNDGDQDLVTADINSSTISVLLNDGDGTFTPSQTLPCGSTTRQVHGGDFDGDNDIDLCGSSNGTSRVFLFFNNGDGTFAPGVPYTNVQNGAWAVRAADLNGDGWVDLGVACQAADSLTILTNQGGGAFVTTGSYRIGDGPWCLNGNDLDGDGDFDFVTVASYANRFVALYNDGTGAFPTRQQLATQSFPLGVFAADLDGDGDIDATSSNYTGGSVGVYRNNGAGQFALQLNLPVNRSGSYTWAHDLDGDGDLDLSVVDEESDSLYVFYNGPAPVGVGESAVGGTRAGAPGLLLAPNPAHVGQAVSLAPRGIGPGDRLAIEVLRPDGRLLRRVVLGAGPTAWSGLLWDGRDEAGNLVPPGRYAIRLTTGGTSVTQALVVLR